MSTPGIIQIGKGDPSLIAQSADGTLGIVAGADNKLYLIGDDGSQTEVGSPSLLMVTQASHGFSVNQAVYLSGVNTFALAQANDASTTLVAGVVSEVIDANTFVLALDGANLATPLPPGVYWLSAVTAGLISTSKPSGVGTFEMRVVVAVDGQSQVSLDGPFDNAPITNSDVATMPANTVKANLLEASSQPQDATYSQLISELFPGGTNTQVLTRTSSGYEWQDAASGSVVPTTPQVLTSETINLNNIPHLTSFTVALGANWEPEFTNIGSNVGKRFRGYVTNPSTFTVDWVNVDSLAGVVQSTDSEMDIYEFEVVDSNTIIGWRVAAGIAADATAPTITSASINTAGNTLTINFSEPVQVGAGGSGGFTLGGLSTSATLSSFSLAENGLSATFAISRAITSAETPTLSYTQPGNGIEDLAGNDLASITGGGITNNSTVSGYLVSEDFEGTGAPAGWTVEGSPAPNFDYATAPAPLEGSQSVLFFNGGHGLVYNFSALPEVQGFFKFNIPTLSLAVRLIEVRNQSAGQILRLTVSATGQFQLQNSSGTSLVTGTAGQVAGNTTYNVWWRFVTGTGSNGIMQAWIATDETKPGSPVINFTSGTWTQEMNQYRQAVNNTINVIYDKIRLSASAIGSDPS